MLLKLQNIILKMIAQGEDLDRTLNRLCLEVEDLLPGAHVSISTLNLDGELRIRVGPSLPEFPSVSAQRVHSGHSTDPGTPVLSLQEIILAASIEHDTPWPERKQHHAATGLSPCFSSPIFNSKGKLLGTFALHFDGPRASTPLEQSIAKGCLPLCMIALERHERVSERERMAFTDVLTGLSNRARFDAVVRELDSQDWWLILIDVDNLKMINDTFGHAAGDELICAVASRINTEAPASASYRVGGDEFALVLIAAPIAEVLDLTERIITAVGQPALCNSHTTFPSITVGIAQSHAGMSVSEVRRNADIALYHAKERHSGSYILYDDAIETSISRRFNAVQSLTAALRENWVEAWYQPIVEISSQKIVGVEALARICLPDGTICTAAQFYEATKDAEVALALTRRVISCVARDVGIWFRMGFQLRHVGINLSAADFSSGDLPGILQSAFALEGVPLHHAILEVNESVYLEDRDRRVANNIKALREVGMRVAIDDFGTGLASMTRLMTVPVDMIKIDRTFGDGLNGEGAGVIEGIIQIASRLGSEVVAEGIESQQDADFFRERGCLLAQGYHFWDARRPSDITMLLREHGLFKSLPKEPKSARRR